MKDWARCEQSEVGKHECDLTTVALSDGGPFCDIKSVILDVSCMHCGQSGSISVDFTEVQWS